jgi:hypothetical protein
MTSAVEKLFGLLVSVGLSTVERAWWRGGAQRIIHPEMLGVSRQEVVDGNAVAESWRGCRFISMRFGADRDG